MVEQQLKERVFERSFAYVFISEPRFQGSDP
jgi:hypothetical protein